MTLATFTQLVLPALGASLLLGAASVALITVALKTWPLDRTAGARFAVWFSALLALSCVAPAFIAGGAIRLQRVPVIAASLASAQRPHIAAFTASAVRARSAAPLAFSAAQATVSNRAQLWLVLALVWLAGALASLGRIGVGLARLRLLLRDADLLETRTTARGNVRILSADLFTTPVAIGYRHPAVVLPSRMTTTEPASDLDQIVMHELEHVRRYDDVTALVQAVCVAVAWFNPFVHYAARRAAVEREMACDEAVVAQTGKRRTYAQTLWKIATHGATPVPSYLSAYQSRSHTVPRLANLLTPRPPTSARRKIGALAGAFVLQAAVVTAAAASPALVIAPRPIADFARVRLADGQTLVVGGRNADGSALATAQLYNRSGHRIAVIRTHVARWVPVLTALASGDILILGGMTDAGPTASVELYDPHSRTFRLMSPMNIPRAGHTATLLPDGRIVVAAGERAPNQYIDQTELYDPHTGRFTFTTNGSGRIDQTALLIDNGAVLMLGGTDANGPTHCAIIYDPAHHGYRNAGRLVRAGPSTITFRLPRGQLVTHYLHSA